MDKKALKEKYKDEKVFVVMSTDIENIDDKFSPVKHNIELWKKFDNLGHFMYRYDVEGEASVQQIIPYIVIANHNHDKVFITKRIAGEPRLLGKLSIGCGGHINECDGTREVLFKAAVRELFEEVDIEITTPLQIIGYVRDKCSTTNDHTGVVILAQSESDITVKEKDTLEGLWMDLDELVNNYELFEDWGKYIIDHFVENKKIL